MFETNLSALKSDVETGVHTKLDELLADVRAVTDHVGKLEKELEGFCRFKAVALLLAIL